MWKIFLAVGLGFIVGFKGLLKEKGIQCNSKLQTVWLILLIFCMGVSIGRNGEIVKNLPQLGGKALVFAVLAILGSIFAVFLLSKGFLQEEGKDE